MLAVDYWSGDFVLKDWTFVCCPGADRFLQDIETMVGKKSPFWHLFFKFFWMFLTPGSLLVQHSCRIELFNSSCRQTWVRSHNTWSQAQALVSICSRKQRRNYPLKNHEAMVEAEATLLKTHEAILFKTYKAEATRFAGFMKP